MDKVLVAEKISEIAQVIVDKRNIELVRAVVSGSAKSPLVQVFIDKINGVSLEDCTEVSREISAILDENDFIDSAYILEVSSPGLERELYSLADFSKFVGSLAKVRTKMAIAGQRNFRGIIKAVENGEIIFADKVNGDVRFAFEAVGKANLEIDVEEEFRRAKS